MIFKQFYLNCLAHASKLVGDEHTRVAAVVDRGRSSMAASLLQQYGFIRVSEWAGGIAAWETANLPVGHESVAATS